MADPGVQVSVRQSLVGNGANSIGHGGTFPHFYKWLGTGVTVSRTANKKLAKKTVQTITKALAKTTNCTLESTEVEGHDQKFLRHFALNSSPPPTFKFVPATLLVGSTGFKFGRFL